MIRTLFVLLIVAGTANAQLPTDKSKIVDYLQDISVTVKSGSGTGSGVTIIRGDDTYVLTAAHVVDDLRKTRKKIVDGAEKTIVEFDDAKVIKVYVQDGRTVGKSEMDAEIIKFSDADEGHDIALLHVRQKKFGTASAVIYNDATPPKLGTQLLHVGSLLGEQGSNSLTRGIESQYGRLINKMVFDQSSVTSFPGSSGGGIYLEETGAYIGMLVRGAGEGFNLMVPARRIKEWSRAAKVEWVVDASIPAPSLEDIRKLPVED